MYQQGQPITPKEAKALAVSVAEKGSGWVSSNPLVGCVIVDKDHRFLSSGFHAKIGADHAEIDALKKITNQEMLKGAVLYVTLEPCAHIGQTPSCAHYIKQLPLAGVVFGAKDPNPKASGGAQIINENGIKCEWDSEWNKDCRNLAEVFFCNIELKRAFINIKTAISLDGKFSGLVASERMHITSKQMQDDARKLRAQCDATLVSAQTIISDDPLLNYRDTIWSQKDHKVVILDKNLDLVKYKNLRIFKTCKNIFLITSKVENFESDNVIMIQSDLRDDGHFDLRKIAQKLYQDYALCSLFVEGGAYLHGTFFDQETFDKVDIFQSFNVIGSKGRSWYEKIRLNSQLRLARLREYSAGLHLVMYPEKTTH